MPQQTSVPSVAAANSTSPFAHLAAKKADDDDENMTESDPKDETDKDEKDGKKGKGKKGKKAADDDKDKDKDASTDEDDKDASENDGDDDDDKKKSSEYRAGKRDGIKVGERQGADRMQARIRAIMTSDVGLAHPAAAAQVAMETQTPAKDAIATLKAVAMMAPTGQRDALRDRMSSQVQPNIGGVAGDDPSANNDGGSFVATPAGIIAAGKKARGEA